MFAPLLQNNLNGKENDNEMLKCEINQNEVEYVEVE
jgi:hypothetical protein